MGEEKEIYELIVAYLREDISDEDMVILQEWLNQNEWHQKLLNELRDKAILRQDVNAFASFDTGKSWKSLEHKMRKTLVKKSRGIFRWSAAAVIVLGGLFSLLYLHNNEKPKDTSIEIAQIQPGETRAVLITGDGRQVSLQGMKDTALMFAANERVEIGKDGELRYSPSVESFIPEWHTLRIPRGGEFRITLDDGTEVWLNSASELRYPSHFVGEERRVELIGEAYFKVARNETAPFIVDTKDMDVRVLGTSFNVSVYPDEEKSHATLVEGRVEVKNKMNGKNVLLEPGEQALLQGEKMDVRKVNTKLYSIWRLDRFTFSSEDMEGVIRKLSRWYNVNVFFENPSMKQKRFTGSLPKYTDISKVLKIIEMTTDIKFQVKGNTIIIQ